MLMPTKQNSLSLPKNLALTNMNMAGGVLKKDRFALPPQCNGPELLSSAPLIVKLIPEILSENSNFDNSGIVCPLRVNNIPVPSSS